MTISFRTSTAALYSRTVTDVTRAQADLAKIQNQITSEREANTFVEMSDKIGRVMDIESTMGRIDTQVRNNKLVITRLQTMSTSMDQIEAIATELKNALATENSSSGDQNPLEDLAKGMLARITDQLNVKQSGRSLFSGSRTNVDPVGDIVNVSNLSGDVPTSNYYAGDNVDLTIRATDRLEINYGVRANDPAFATLIGALHMAIEADGETGHVALDKAIEMANSAVLQLADVHSKINTDIVTLNSVNSEHDATKLQLTQVYSDEVGTDVVEASIKASLKESVLQATLQTFARISQITLTQYLN